MGPEIEVVEHEARLLEALPHPRPPWHRALDLMPGGPEALAKLYEMLFGTTKLAVVEYLEDAHRGVAGTHHSRRAAAPPRKAAS